MAQPVNCFFAYTGRDIQHSETIEAAINMINQSAADVVHITGWKALNVPGTVVIQEICEEIERSKVFICDLTRFNVNVIFELGFAMVKDKRIWIVLDPSIEAAKSTYRQFKPLANCGYSEYRNEHELLGDFFRSKPYEDLDNTIYRTLRETASYLGDRNRLLYLKSKIPTHASIRLTRAARESKLDIRVDDATEESMQSLTWYFAETLNATAVLIHLLDDERAVNEDALQNPKMAIVAGMAHGLGKPLLMLAQNPYDAPIDYMHLLCVRDTASQIAAKAEEWLSEIEKYMSATQQAAESVRRTHAASSALRDLIIGQSVAELEANNLLDYFVDTAAFREALLTPQSIIFVGRKGSGKTANLIALELELQEGRRNHICAIRPPDYELQAIVRLLTSSLARSDPGYLNQSLWKFLVYTELAKSAYHELLARPMLQPAEQGYISFVEQHSQAILEDFTVRLEHTVTQLSLLPSNESISDQRAKISEVLHSSMLPELRRELGRIFHSRNKVVVLIDNLDKAWGKSSESQLLAEFLFGLLSASKAIADDFQKQGMTWQSVNLSLIIFLRSDIFAFIKASAREADKLSYSYMRWDEPQLLYEVIEQRFENATQGRIKAEEVWEYFFPKTVRGQSTQEYILAHILPKPRDIIVFCKAALESAGSRRHNMIEEDDILKAQEQYSSVHAIVYLHAL